MSLLTLIQRAASKVGLPQPSTVIGNVDLNVVRLLEAANEEGEELASKHDWTILQREHTFSTASGTAEYALPSDYAAYLSDTVWNRSDYQAIRGPLRGQEWQVYKSGAIGGIVNQRWRLKRTASGNTDTIYIDPTPTATETVAIEYRSDAWCQSSGGTAQVKWTADTDTGILSERLMRLGTAWRFKRMVGTDFDTQLAEYEQAVSRAIADDINPGILTLHGRRRVPVLGGFTPETGYGS